MATARLLQEPVGRLKITRNNHYHSSCSAGRLLCTRDKRFGLRAAGTQTLDTCRSPHARHSFALTPEQNCFSKRDSRRPRYRPPALNTTCLDSFDQCTPLLGRCATSDMSKPDSVAIKRDPYLRRKLRTYLMELQRV